MILYSQSGTVKEDATAPHEVKQRSDPSNQGRHIMFISITYTSVILTLGYRLDVHEDIEKNIVTATFDFPGFSKDEVQISFQNGKLTVSAEAKKSEEQAETGYTLRERPRGRLSRTLQLPEGVQVCPFP